MASFSRAKLPLLTLLLAFTFFFVSFATLIYDVSFWEGLQDTHQVNATLAQPLNTALHDYFLNSDYTNPLAYPGLTEEEARHMVDVKKRVTLAVVFALLSAIFSVVLLAREKKTILSKVAIASTALTWAIPLLFFFIPFDPLFTLFHQLFFEEGTYLFSWGSLLITVYPQGFFQDFAVAIVKRAYLFGLIALIVGLIVKKFK